jgi:hypothetical protein
VDNDLERMRRLRTYLLAIAVEMSRDAAMCDVRDDA